MRQLIHDYKEYNLNVGGLRVVFFFNSGMRLSAKPKRSSDMHTHYHGELFTVFEGEMRIIAGNKEFTVNKGEHILIPQNVMHRPEYTDDIFRCSVGFTISGKGKVSSPIAERLSSLIEACEPIKLSNPHITDCIKRFMGYYYGKSDFKDELIYGCLYELLALLCSDGGRVTGIDTHPFDDTKNYRKYTVQEYFTVRARDGVYNYGELTLEELGEILNLSPKQAQRTVKALFGRSFREEILLRKMNKAAELLKNTDEGVNRIATALGYSGTRSFYKHFKDEFGQTPSEYRKNIK